MATDGFPAHGVWTTEEDKILREGLERHRMKATLAACKEIAAALPRKTIVDVAMRCEWLLVAGKITSLLEYHVSRPVGHMSSDGINTDRDIGEVRRNLLDSTSNILKGVGENPQLWCKDGRPYCRGAVGLVRGNSKYDPLCASPLTY
ncbi:uncharacterized protein LOC120270099 isoform X2 [Dioscorea cayenensis subsp. rotundata]|uniref:Uncharacterized protein LOC120270099 isoform X2 n=1 Tax=Dioscorea cayennensis subsp. rotundata TaxID=55577 RepID=A0AB40C2D4_DIOCR|nr:uncharacterized protein LOC120270099 isoform X2 [Dioscorea cayenensis subsp. rotundata]